jgi:type I restriction enzyme M protein
MQTRTRRVLAGIETTEQVPGTHQLDGDGRIVDGTGDPLPPSDIGRIVYAFRQWRGEPAPVWWDPQRHGEWAYRDVPGFCKSATIADVDKHGFVLTPGRYVGVEEQEDDGESFAEKFPRLVAELEEHFAAGERLASLVREKLREIDHDG